MAIASDSVRRSRPLLGTFVEITVLDARQPNVTDAIEHAFETVARVHRLMSFHDPDSDVSRLNFRVGSEVIGVDPWTYEVLEALADLHRRSAGAFDITVAPALQDIGLLPRHDRELSPRPAARQQVDAIELLPENRVRFRHPSVGIDLGGIAKGYAVDRGIHILQRLGIKHALVSAGGDSRIIGDRFGKPWIVGIRHPDRKDEVIARLPLVDTAISTSGDYERYYDEDGVRYHHIIDPRTGHSARAVRSATILAATATRSDGLSKTAFVLGAEAAIKIYEGLGDVDAILVQPDGKVLYTKGLEPPAAAH